jgi:glycosyltransferase involved in cell wall biosynthesis
VDATCWHNNRGYGRHARALLTALVRADGGLRYTFFVDSETDLESVPRAAELRYVRSGKAAAIAAAADGHRSPVDMWRMSRALSDSRFDLVLFPSAYTYVPVWTRARKVVIVHDVIAESFPRLTHPALLPRLLWRAKIALGVKQADALITVSEFSKRGIVGRFRVPPRQVHVVGEACDPAFRVLDRPSLPPRLRSLGLRESHRLVIYVGGFGPHKNVGALVDSFAGIAERPGNEDLRLVLVGEYRKEVFHSGAGEVAGAIARLGIADRVVWTGYLTDADVVHLMNLASVLVLPSLMEGFGLPAVEAAACGCPVIATKASPLPDVLGEGGIYIDPAKPAELENALALVLGSDELRLRMRQAGIEATRALSWDAAAASLSQRMREVANQ